MKAGSPKIAVQPSLTPAQLVQLSRQQPYTSWWGQKQTTMLWLPAAHQLGVKHPLPGQGQDGGAAVALLVHASVVQHGYL